MRLSDECGSTDSRAIERENAKRPDAFSLSNFGRLNQVGFILRPAFLFGKANL
jgi:hypothetical protein